MADTIDDGPLQLLREVLARASREKVAPSSIDPDTTLKGLGIDSLKFIMVMLDVEKKLGRRVFNAANIGAMETVRDMWNLMAQGQSPVTPVKEER
jgi:acyl carrier protein